MAWESSKELHAHVLITDHDTKPSAATLEAIACHQEVIIYGGYYRESAAQLHAINSRITHVVSSKHDEKAIKDAGANVLLVKGPCMWTMRRIDELTKELKEPVFSFPDEQVAYALDDYLGGEPDAESIWLYQGISQMPGDGIREQLRNLRTDENLARARQLGRERWEQDLKKVKPRVEHGITMRLQAYGKQYVMVSVAEGDSPVVATAYALAEASECGVGVAIRHDYASDKTRITIVVQSARLSQWWGRKYNTQSVPEIGADDLAELWCKGGGSSWWAGGEKPGLLFPQQFFADVIVA